MTRTFQISIRRLVFLQLVLLLVAGWLADHVYLARKAQIVVQLNDIAAAAEAARAARSAAEYNEACDQFRGGLWAVVRRKSYRSLAVPVLASAIRVPEWDYGNSDELRDSLSAEAAIGLAALGEDAIPVALGLLHDRDAQVRARAAETLCYITGAYRHVYVTPAGTQERLLVPVVYALDSETDDSVRQHLAALKRKLSTALGKH